MSTEEWEQAFKVFDVSGDGKITAEELEKVMNQCGVNPSKLEIEAIMFEADTDGSKTITLDEFIKYMSKPQRPSYGSDELKQQFEIFDTDGDGFITRGEMDNVLDKLQLSDFPKEAVDTIFTECDKDNDGKINFDEFVSAMK